MAVAQRIPLPLTDDGDERVKLQQQHAVRFGCGRAEFEGGALVGIVHDAEAVEHHACVFTLDEAAFGEQRQPRSTVWAAELAHRRAPQPARVGDALHGVGGLVPQRLRLNTARLIGHCVVFSELR